MNVPDRVDAVMLPEGRQKVEMSTVETVPNAASFRFLREDHTLGHMLRCALLKNDNVRFAGYKHPHPLDHDIEVKLRVKRDDRSQISPEEVMRDTLHGLREQLEGIRHSFAVAFAEYERTSHDM